MDKVNEYLKENSRYHEIPWFDGTIKKTPDVTAAVICKDGYEVSIQASSYHYSDPREDFAWPYKEVELGFPSQADELISEYAEDPDAPTRTVYGYVPIDVVNKLIEKHGGIRDVEK